MTRQSPLKPLLTLALLLSFSMGCTKTVYVPTPVYPPSCDPGPAPSFPQVQSTRCGEQVCLSPSDTTAIWLYGRQVVRYIERVNVCLPKTAAHEALSGYEWSTKETMARAFEGWGF